MKFLTKNGYLLRFSNAIYNIFAHKKMLMIPIIVLLAFGMYDIIKLQQIMHSTDSILESLNKDTKIPPETNIIPKIDLPSNNDIIRTPLELNIKQKVKKQRIYIAKGDITPKQTLVSSNNKIMFSNEKDNNIVVKTSKKVWLGITFVPKSIISFFRTN